MPPVDERVADGAHRVTLADAGQPEGEHIGRVGEEVALRELVQLGIRMQTQADDVQQSACCRLDRGETAILQYLPQLLL